MVRTAREAARRKFSPEFMNRLDQIVVFRGLRQQELNRILDLELQAVERRIEQAQTVEFSFSVTGGAREILLTEGTDARYGARHLKRSIERFLVHPLANLMASSQVRTGDVIVVDRDREGPGLHFFRDETEAAIARAAIDKAQARQITEDISLKIA